MRTELSEAGCQELTTNMKHSQPAHTQPAAPRGQPAVREPDVPLRCTFTAPGLAEQCAQPEAPRRARWRAASCLSSPMEAKRSSKAWRRVGGMKVHTT